VARSKGRLIGILIAAAMTILAFPAAASAATDTVPPEFTAALSGDTFTVTATDDASGVTAVYVDGHRVNALSDGRASINLKDYAGNAAKVTLYAVDGAGNRSKAQEMDNPYYRPPVPLSAQSQTQTSQASAPAQAQTDAPAAAQPGQQDTAEEQETDGGAQAGGTAATGAAFTPDGTGTVLDNVTDADGKEFYTIVTDAGNIFYLVIDRQRTDGGVYFLNAVTESDLAALAQTEDEGADAGIFGGDTGETDGPPEVEEPTPAPEPEPTPEPEPEGMPIGTIAFVLLAVAAIGGAGYYVKIVRPRRQEADEEDDEGWEDFFDKDEGYEQNGFSPGDEASANEPVDDDLDDLIDEPHQ
jgi:hypothetical protein